MKYWIRGVVVLGLLGYLTGCGVSPSQLAIESASREFNCPEDELEAKWLDVRKYRVKGCGNSAVYVCSTSKEKCKKDSMGPFWN